MAQNSSFLRAYEPLGGVSMGIRILASVSLASVTLTATLGVFLVRAEAKMAPESSRANMVPSSSLEARVVAQGKMIKQLQTQVAALLHASSTSKTVQAHITSRSGRTRKLPDITHKLKIADISPGLKSLSTHHAQFLNIPIIHPIPFPSHPPTALQQLAAQVAQLSTQVTQLSSQVGSIKSEVVFDENLFGTEFLLVQKNLSTVAASVPVMPPGQGFCGGNGGMSWGGLKYYINNPQMDNDFFCYLVQ
jgi:hypothetical protein